MSRSEPPPDPRRLIVVGDHTVTLPDGVTVATWALERKQFQNARIRILLGTIDLLEEVLDSNYAILHSSPARLHEIWRQVRRVADIIRHEVAPLFEQPSAVPAIERARQTVKSALHVLSWHVLSGLDRYPAELPRQQLTEVRKLLCVSIGQLHAFLQDAFGAIMEADPRSANDKDYFLSRRFPRDIEEAEWLHRSVVALDNFLQDIGHDAAQVLGPLVKRLETDETLPTDRGWQTVEAFVERMDELTEKIREILALRGIRFDEMEALDRYSQEIPVRCARMLELYGTGREAVRVMKADTPEGWAERRAVVGGLARCHAVFCRRIAGEARGLFAIVTDLVSFTPLWLVNIGERRALLLYKGARVREAESQETG